ncbi:MAG: hypothetical protein DRQ89_15095 [Epsilonproteobacteria bacterium]|nr:MAG: hypothetical protein DRQ89_15095 [Campylobacterota bacterium]
MKEAVEGLKELSIKLSRMERATGLKAMRSAAMAATLPTVKEMRAAAPKGNRTHRTFKGRLVAPGFLSRSIIRKTRTGNGVITVTIGTRREAFYGVAFLDEGTKKIAGRRWFEERFSRNSNQIVSLFKQKLADRIAKATRAST